MEKEPGREAQISETPCSNISSKLKYCFQAADDDKRSMALAAMETMFGLGTMIGPFLGGVLYEVGGFYLPFVICGSGLIACSVLGVVVLKPVEEDGKAETDDDDDLGRNTTYVKLLKMPTIVVSALILTITGISVSWYLPSLQVYVFF